MPSVSRLGPRQNFAALSMPGLPLSRRMRFAYSPYAPALPALPALTSLAPTLRRGSKGGRSASSFGKAGAGTWADATPTAHPRRPR